MPSTPPTPGKRHRIAPHIIARYNLGPDERPGRAVLPERLDEPVVPADECFDAVYGLEIIEHDPPAGVIAGRVPVCDNVKQISGALHGGVLIAAAETLATRTTVTAVFDAGKTAFGMSNDTTCIRPIVVGYAHVTARVTILVRIPGCGTSRPTTTQTACARSPASALPSVRRTPGRPPIDAPI